VAESEIVPRITTRRLVLRELRRSDFDAYAACLADRVEPPGPVDRRTAWRIFAASTGVWLLDGVGWWAVELAETSEFVGTCGAFYREAHPDRETTDKELELGWTIVPAFRRRGYATEAAAAALDFAFERRRPRRVIALIHHDNHPSIRVSEGIGMHFEREISFYSIRLNLHVAERGG
jgi:RimJ/RimL family protein N-acetyltransferase